MFAINRKFGLSKRQIRSNHRGWAFTREAYDKMRTDLKTTGMEFASEMLEIGIRKVKKRYI